MSRSQVHQLPAARTPAAEITDPVHLLALKLAATDTACCQSEEYASKAGRVGSKLDHARYGQLSNASHRENRAIADQILLTRATTLAGLMSQILQMATLAEDLAIEEFTDAQRRERRDRVRIGTTLMLDTIEELSGLDRTDFVGGDFFSAKEFRSISSVLNEMDDRLSGGTA